MVSLLPAWLWLMQLWAEPLRSIGMLFPAVSLVLILRAWKSLDWELRGTWWGAALVAFALLYARASGIIMFLPNPNGTNPSAFVQILMMVLSPVNTVFLCVSGLVLLLGGTRLWRKAMFPLLLLLFLNPVPHSFSGAVDIPLQYFAANVARHFGALFGFHPTGKQFDVIFTPEDGMWIAPGCDGLHGSITMGYIALVMGYLYRFRRRVLALVVVGAVLLGYVFNLLRLFALVIFDILSLRFTSWGNHEPQFDLTIGGTLFTVAVVLFALAIKKYQLPAEARLEQAGAPQSRATGRENAGSLAYRAAVLLVLAFPFVVSYVPAIHGEILNRSSSTITNHLLLLPSNVGSYKLIHSSDDVPYTIGTYSTGRAGDYEVSLGIWTEKISHDPIYCRLITGVKQPIAEKSMSVMSLGSRAVSLNTQHVNLDPGATFRATAICSVHGCANESRTDVKQGFSVLYRPENLRLLRWQDPAATTSVTLAAESDAPTVSDAEKLKLQQQVLNFASKLDWQPIMQFAQNH